MQPLIAGIFGMGTQEMLIVLLIILILFGATALPKLAKALGESARELRKGIENEPNKEDNPDDRNKPKS